MDDSTRSAQSVLTRNPEGISHTERPVRFRAAGEEVFGILTEPLGAPRHIAAVLLNAASDRNRFLPRLARRLAAAGFHVLRFDYRGVGESSGHLTGSRHKRAMMNLQSADEPFTDDILGAVHDLRGRGLHAMVLIGRCFGGRTALSAVQQISDLRGVAVISLPVHTSGQGHSSDRWAVDELRGAVRRGVRLSMFRALLSPKRRARWFRVLGHAAGLLVRRPLAAPGGELRAGAWVARAVVDSVSDLAARRVPLLFVYGSDESVYRDFLAARAGPLGPILARAGDRATILAIDGPVTAMTDVEIQETMMARLQDWLVSTVGAPAS